MSKKIEVKVNMHSEKCKIQVLKAVTKVLGINEVSVNLEKQMLIVIGDVDPVCVVARLRKTGKIAEIVSVGPPKKPDPKPTPCTDPCFKSCCANLCPKPCTYPCLKPCCANLCPKPCLDPSEIIYPYSACYDTRPAFIGGYPQSYCNDGGCFIL